MIYKKYLLVIFIAFNVYLQYLLDIPKFDQIITLMITYGVFSYYKEQKFKVDRNINKFQIILSFCLFIAVLYRSYWLHISDNFIYLLFPILSLIYALISNNIYNSFLHLKPFLITLVLPISKILFIPLSILITPISTFFTWLALNTFGFYSSMNGQEIVYNSPGIDVTFSCSGSGQILFSLSAMIILNICFPLKNSRLFLIQLNRAFLFTFSSNIIRLFLLAIYSYTYDYEGFSIFRYLHGGNGGLFFSFFSMLLSCESYKRLYLGNVK